MKRPVPVLILLGLTLVALAFAIDHFGYLWEVRKWHQLHGDDSVPRPLIAFQWYLTALIVGGLGVVSGGIGLAIGIGKSVRTSAAQSSD